MQMGNVQAPSSISRQLCLSLSPLIARAGLASPPGLPGLPPASWGNCPLRAVGFPSCPFHTLRASGEVSCAWEEQGRRPWPEGGGGLLVGGGAGMPRARLLPTAALPLPEAAWHLGPSEGLSASWERQKAVPRTPRQSSIINNALPEPLSLSGTLPCRSVDPQRTLPEIWVMRQVLVRPTLEVGFLPLQVPSPQCFLEASSWGQPASQLSPTGASSSSLPQGRGSAVGFCLLFYLMRFSLNAALT